MSLNVRAELSLSVDGQTATIRGAGRRVRMEMSDTSMLRQIRKTDIPGLEKFGNMPPLTDIPKILAGEGLTLDIADHRGVLLTLGAEADERGWWIPFVGRIEHFSLGGIRAFVRLIFHG
ncbi:MAG: hypothetical protein U5L04_06175 [Trueperaceae bacterium]|nr:hypothetical protein [Trueperaceae bacterium]